MPPYTIWPLDRDDLYYVKKYPTGQLVFIGTLKDCESFKRGDLLTETIKMKLGGI